MSVKIINGISCRALRVGEVIEKGDLYFNGKMPTMNVGRRVVYTSHIYRPIKTPRKRAGKVKPILMWVSKSIFDSVASHTTKSRDARIAELETCVHCSGSGDGYCDKDGWHDCEKCKGTGLKNGVREIQKRDVRIAELLQQLGVANHEISLLKINDRLRNNKEDALKRGVATLWQSVLDGHYSPRSIVGDVTLDMKEILFGDSWPIESALTPPEPREGNNSTGAGA